MNNEQRAHELSIAYLLYREISDNPATQEDFFEGYERAFDTFRELLKDKSSRL